VSVPTIHLLSFSQTLDLHDAAYLRYTIRNHERHVMIPVNALLGQSIKHFARLKRNKSGVLSRFLIEDYDFTAQTLVGGVYAPIEGATVVPATPAEIAGLANTVAAEVGVLAVSYPGSTSPGTFAMRSSATEVRLIGVSKADGAVVEVLPVIVVTRT
jgi:hypothetical protein